MQNRAPNSIASPVREVRLHLSVVVKETNAAKWRCLHGADTNAKLAKRCHSIRHDALATRFVDGRLRAVNDGDSQTLLSSCNGRRKASGTSASHEHFGLKNGFEH